MNSTSARWGRRSRDGRGGKGRGGEEGTEICYIFHDNCKCNIRTIKL